MASRKKLGEILLSEGLIDEIQLKSAMGHQRNWGGKLGSALVELGFLKEDDIAKVLEEQLKLHCLSEADLVPEPEALKVISMQEALKYSVLPLKVSGHELTLAMSNPFDLPVIDELGFKLGKRVKGLMAVESTIKAAIKRFYGEGGGREYKVDVKAAQASPDAEVIHYGGKEKKQEEQAKAAEAAKVTPSPDLIAKALAYLLIEKGLINRDELVDKMKVLKEKGL